MTLVASTKTASPYTPIDVERLSDLHGRLYELIHGELVEKIVSAEANLIAGHIVTRLNNTYSGWRAYVFPEQPTYCFPDPKHGRRPDVCLVWRERLPEGVTDEEIYVVPDLVVEVVSPSNIYSDIRERVNEFLEAGVPLVWIVEPAFRSIVIYRKDGSVGWFREADVLSNEPALPDFSVRVGDLFPPPALTPATQP
jgi:Uma2 family endonuclease